MVLKNKIITKTLLPLFCGIFVIITSCSSNHEDHNEVPAGLVLLQNETVLVSQDNGVVTYPEGDAIEVPVSETTETIQIRFISEEGHRFIPDTGEYQPGYSIDNTDILEIIHPIDNDEWSFRLNGLSEGTTEIQIELQHLGHLDFQSQKIQVRVISQNDELDN